MLSGPGAGAGLTWEVFGADLVDRWVIKAPSQGSELTPRRTWCTCEVLASRHMAFLGYHMNLLVTFNTSLYFGKPRIV